MPNKWRKFDRSETDHEALRTGLKVRLAGREGIIKWMGDSTHYPNVVFDGKKLIEGIDIYNFPDLEIEDKSSNVRVNRETALAIKVELSNFRMPIQGLYEYERQMHDMFKWIDSITADET